MKRPMGKIHCSGNIVHEPFKEFSAPMKSFQMAKTSSRPEAGSDFRLPSPTGARDSLGFSLSGNLEWDRVDENVG
jgi:hypothetical protein